MSSNLSPAIEDIVIGLNRPTIDFLKNDGYVSCEYHYIKRYGGDEVGIFWSSGKLLQPSWLVEEGIKPTILEKLSSDYGPILSMRRAFTQFFFITGMPK